MWISRFYLGYLHAINHSSAASHRFIARMLQNCSHLSKFCYRPALPFAQVWSAQAPAQEHRVPTIGPALLPTGSGQAPTRLLSHDAETVVRAQARPCRGAATEGVLARKPMLVAYLQSAKSVFPQHRTREWGHWCPSEHSLMDTRGRPLSILRWKPGRVHRACSD